jgi:hypothetical protein
MSLRNFFLKIEKELNFEDFHKVFFFKKFCEFYGIKNLEKKHLDYFFLNKGFLKPSIFNRILKKTFNNDLTKTHLRMLFLILKKNFLKLSYTEPKYFLYYNLFTEEYFAKKSTHFSIQENSHLLFSKPSQKILCFFLEQNLCLKDLIKINKENSYIDNNILYFKGHILCNLSEEISLLIQEYLQNNFYLFSFKEKELSYSVMLKRSFDLKNRVRKLL